MKILSMTATFGKLEHQTLTLEPGLNVIEAPNEWGKSTWCAFIVAMLYGIDTGARSKKDFLADKEHYAPWSGLPMSGRMDILWNDRAITIERSNKGRIPFGEFRAYETESNLPVPELTAANCGQVLLGVEKEVFTRAGFLKLSDLPVTQDDALRRRLNALVTTGDESGASDALAQKLKDLRNACRHNKTGQLPQAEAQREKLQTNLEQLQLLQEQVKRNKARQEELDSLVRELENHQNALAYDANRTFSQKLAAAEAVCETAKRKFQEAEAACRELPPQPDVLDTLSKLRRYRDSWDSLHMEAQLLPPPPQAPETSVYFRELSPEDALRQAKADTESYNAAVQKGKRNSLTIVGIILAFISAIGLSINNPIAKLGGVAVILSGIILCLINIVDRRKARERANAIAQKYAPLPVENWIFAAENYSRVQADYRQAQLAYTNSRADLDARLTALKAQINALTDGITLPECEQRYKAAEASWATYEEASREYRRATEFSGALASSYKEVAPPAFPDQLTYTAEETMKLLSDAAFEHRQLQLKLGQYLGQMDSLGQEDSLRQQLSAVQTRIARLEDTYAALTIAMETLCVASNELQRRFAPRISKRAQELFGKLTVGRYNRLTLGEDLSLSAAAADEDTLHTAIWRSEGTIDQLYLALRLAVAEELTPDAPMVLDDAFVRFDDKRLAAAMDILKEESQSKQVILFTCQNREKQYL